MRVLIVGAGLAGARTAEALRAGGHAGPLTLVGAAPTLPYDRPPLSKGALAGTCTLEELVLRPAEGWAELGVELRLGSPAHALDPAARKVVLGDGSVLGYDQLVVATGLTPRTLPAAAGLDGVRTLRTVEDCRALRAALRPGCRVVVVGGGVLGCEVAATLRTAGYPVALVEPLPGPLWQAVNGPVGAAVSARVRAWHERRGVRLYLGRTVARMSGRAGRVSAVVLDDGSELPADLVVVAIGARPETAWLDGSGVPLDDGVVCDEYGAAGGPDGAGVWAVGDVARFPSVHGGSTRVEHWTNACEMANAVAGNLLAGADRMPFRPLHYFWSDQYGVKLQSVGWPGIADETRLVGDDPDTGAFLAAYGRAGRLVAVVGAGRARAVIGSRALLAAGVTVDDAVAAWSR